MTDTLLVFIGGGLGAVGRYWLSGAIPNLVSSLFWYAAIVVGKKSHTLLVTTTALMHNDEPNVSSVMAVTDSIAYSVPVVLGSVRDSFAEVSSQLFIIGTQVITESHYKLPNSTRIRIIQ